MLTLFDRDSRSLRGGMSRRSFLQIGGVGLTGLTLPWLLAAEAASAGAGGGGSQKSLIMIYLVGGPPHLDMWDLKPDAPVEVRGEFRPIRTNVPGIELCEHLPRMAKMMDKFAVLRSIVGAQDDHNAFQCYTGRDQRRVMPTGDWPQLGSAVARVQGAANPAMPPFVSLCYRCSHGPYNEPGPGYLGVGQAGFAALGASRENMVLQGVTAGRMNDRRQLLAAMDRLRRDADASGQMSGMDQFTAQAMDILSSSKLADALDLSKEDPRVVARYGTGDATVFMDDNGAPRVPQNFLMARRLIEAGVRVVTVAYSKWDWHGGPGNSIFKRQREDLPVFDQGITALVEDLHARGLDRDVSVIAWGEFGRTPTINAGGGRDHWPRVSGAILAGGGMKMGQVIGATDRLGGEAVSRPVTFPDVFATLYHRLGIDPDAVTIADLQGRPQYLVEPGATRIAELG
ncbi:MAG: DUF1501 domain-containing protein [Pirellulales bacterium]